MKILNYGSLNIDHVYKVDHFLRPGETMSSHNYQQFCGGKGLNQSIALSYAGAEVFHAGKVGTDGQILIDKLKQAKVDTRFVKMDTGVSGHAIIQVNTDGDNCILLHGGANKSITLEEIQSVLDCFSIGDYLLLQNEINGIDQIIKIAKAKGLKIVLNPAPMNDQVFHYPLELVDIFVVNEVEGSDLTGETDPDLILNNMLKQYPDASIVLTLGAKGVRYADINSRYDVPADTTVTVVDTTAAGDTFIGYFLSCISQNKDILDAITTACLACAICVSRNGASISIPRKEELPPNS